MEIDVNFFGAFRELVKERVVQVEVAEGTTLQELIEKLCQKFGDGLRQKLLTRGGGLQQSVSILFGDEPVDELQHSLGSTMKKSNVYIVQPMRGGADEDDVWLNSVCNQCYSCCAIRAHVKKGILVKIEGNPDCTDTVGRICSKGMAGIMLLYDPNRVNTPFKRTNPKKGMGIDPGWKPISWDEAMDIMVEKLSKVRQEDPRKLLVTGSVISRSLWGHLLGFAQAFGTPNVWNSGAGTHCGAGEHIMAAIMHHAWAWQPDPEYTRYFLNFGSPVGHGAHYANVAMSQRLAAARAAHSMKHVVIDPWMGAAAEKGDEWIPIRPGTDAAFVLAMVSLLLNEYKIYDSVRLKHHTNGPYLIGPDGHYVRDTTTGKPLVWDTGSQKAKPYDEATVQDFALEGSYTVNGVSCRPAFALLREHVQKYTVDFASGVTTIPPETIRRIARELGEAASIGSTIRIQGKELPYRPVCIGYFKGPQGHRHAALTAMSFEILNQILGISAVPGGLLSPGARCMGDPWMGKQWGPQVGPDGLLALDKNAGWTMASYNPYPPREAKEPFSFTLVECVPTPGSTSFTPLVLADPKKYGLNYEPEVHINGGSNYVLTTADPELVAKAFTKMFTISVSLFLDESTELADLVIPDTCYLERLDINADSPTTTGSPALRDPWTVHLRQPVVSPLYERRQFEQVSLELADRLGMGRELCMVMNMSHQLKGDLRLDPARKYTWEEIVDRKYRSSYGNEHGIQWFKKNGILKWPKKVEEVYWSPFVNVRVPIYFEWFPGVGEQVKRIVQKTGIPFDVEDFQSLPDWKPCPAYVEKRSDYDLYAIYFRSHFHSFTYTNENPWLDEISRVDPYNFNVNINYKTAARKGIKDGEWVEVESAATGQKARARARVVKGIHPEVIALAGSGGHWSKNMPVAAQEGKGINFEWLLPLDFEHVDTVSYNQDLCVKVKVTKVGQ